MKLYYSPGACSMAVHIAARETRLPLELVKVNLATRKLPDGGDYLAVNPRGYVPVLHLDDGTRLTEVTALLQYIADAHPAADLIPAAGTIDRVRQNGWLNFVATELHVNFHPLFDRGAAESTKQGAITTLSAYFAELNQLFATQPYLMGKQFTVADIYAFTVISWSNLLNVSLAPYPSLLSFLGRVGQRPAVIAALQAEGLMPVSPEMVCT